MPISRLTCETLLLTLALGGCSFSLDLRGGTLVNPEDPLSPEVVRNSRELAIRIYQLKAHENLKQVLATPWESFGATEIPEALKPFLVVPADTAPQLRPQEDFFIRRQQRQRFRFPLQKGTRALLVVARGRQPGESSLQLVDVGVFSREVALCFHKYDVFVNQRTWPCAKDGWGDEE